MPTITPHEHRDFSCFYYFRDQAEAEDIAQRLANLGVDNQMECACLKDHGKEMCEDFMSSCRAGVYLSVPPLYAPMVPILLNIIRKGG